MRNIRLKIEYDGTQYAGWQSQLNAPTIQTTVKEAIEKIVGHEVKMMGSGRTDAGVHALAQVANFKTTSNAPMRAFVQGLNSILPGDITVLEAQEVAEDFDSRRSAKTKSYRYRILTSPVPRALEARTSWWVSRKLDLMEMKEAGSLFEGVHDFNAFRSARCDSTHAIRKIISLDVERVEDIIEINVMGTGFLRHMVRIIVGTLVEVGHGKLTVDEVKELIAGGERSEAGITAPAQGLTLMEVVYETGPEDAA